MKSSRKLRDDLHRKDIGEVGGGGGGGWLYSCKFDTGPAMLLPGVEYVNQQKRPSHFHFIV